jgi:hypothetical protein
MEHHLTSDLVRSYKMEITYYENSLGEKMVLILDGANDKSESMTKAEYDRRQAEQSTPN